ncbi:UNVERIFIED_CONTAM: hypothetical protein RMT77_014989 [Armadillidium vulgare]
MKIKHETELRDEYLNIVKEEITHDKSLEEAIPFWKENETVIYSEVVMFLSENIKQEEDEIENGPVSRKSGIIYQTREN